MRHNFDPPTILEILDADFSNTFLADTDDTILIQGYDRPINSDHNYTTPLVLATDYDIYCYATDDLCNNCKVTTTVQASEVELIISFVGFSTFESLVSYAIGTIVTIDIIDK